MRQPLHRSFDALDAPDAHDALDAHDAFSSRVASDDALNALDIITDMELNASGPQAASALPHAHASRPE